MNRCQGCSKLKLCFCTPRVFPLRVVTTEPTPARNPGVTTPTEDILPSLPESETCSTAELQHSEIESLQDPAREDMEHPASVPLHLTQLVLVHKLLSPLLSDTTESMSPRNLDVSAPAEGVQKCMSQNESYSTAWLHNSEITSLSGSSREVLEQPLPTLGEFQIAESVPTPPTQYSRKFLKMSVSIWKRGEPENDQMAANSQHKAKRARLSLLQQVDSEDRCVSPESGQNSSLKTFLTPGHGGPTPTQVQLYNNSLSDAKKLLRKIGKQHELLLASPRVPNIHLGVSAPDKRRYFDLIQQLYETTMNWLSNVSNHADPLEESAPR